MSNIYVTELNTYPIKSCGGISLNDAELTQTGLEFDREWVLTRPNGTLISQRTNPELALVEPSILDEGIMIYTKKLGSFLLPFAAGKGQQEQEIDIFKKVGAGIDQGDDVANYFSDYIGKPVRLFRNSKHRPIKPECRVEGAVDSIAFADGFPILLTSDESLRDLNEYSRKRIAMSQFRPNIVVDGDLDPYSEDYWRQITIGSYAGFHVVRACARCPIPNVDQDVGTLPKPAQRYTTAALKDSRRGVDPLSGSEEVFFGQNVTFTYKNFMNLSVGDQLSVTKSSTERNFLPVSE